MTHKPNNGSGSPPPSEDEGKPTYTRRRKKPNTSGMGYPKVPPSGSGSSGGGEPPKQLDAATPIPVVLTVGTILKLMVPLFGLVSLGLAFYWQTKTHVDDKSIHLESGERAKLETKHEAKEQRKQIVRTIKTHVDLKMRQQRVEQKEQIQKIGEDLKQEQKQALRQILNEVKQTRRTINRRMVPAINP